MGLKNKEMRLLCSTCKKMLEPPVCCGKSMDWDGVEFYCTICGKTKGMPLCCGRPMEAKIIEVTLL